MTRISDASPLGGGEKIPPIARACGLKTSNSALKFIAKGEKARLNANSDAVILPQNRRQGLKE